MEHNTYNITNFLAILVTFVNFYIPVSSSRDCSSKFEQIHRKPLISLNLPIRSLSQNTLEHWIEVGSWFKIR